MCLAFVLVLQGDRYKLPLTKTQNLSWCLKGDSNFSTSIVPNSKMCIGVEGDRSNNPHAITFTFTTYLVVKSRAVPQPEEFWSVGGLSRNTVPQPGDFWRAVGVERLYITPRKRSIHLHSTTFHTFRGILLSVPAPLAWLHGYPSIYNREPLDPAAINAEPARQYKHLNSFHEEFNTLVSIEYHSA